VPGDAPDSANADVSAIDEKLSNAAGVDASYSYRRDPFRIAFFDEPFSRHAVGTGIVPAFKNRMWGP